MEKEGNSGQLAQESHKVKVQTLVFEPKTFGPGLDYPAPLDVETCLAVFFEIHHVHTS